MNAIERKVASKIASLRKQVEAAQQEFDMAIQFHEAWKPAAYDEALHKRMGTSFATKTFLIVRSALRREMLLALMRLWDKNPKALRMKQSIADVLRDQSVINALAADRAARIARTLQQSLGRVEGLTIADVQDRMRREVSEPASKAIALVDKYSKGGSHYTVLESLLDCGTNVSHITKLRPQR